MVQEVLTESLAAVRGRLPLFAALIAATAAAFAAERLLERRLGAASRRWVHHAALALAVAAGLWLGWQLLFLCDDAFISFRYADNLAAGHGLVWNEGEWVEGYTNFLWTAMLGGASWIGLDIPLVALFGCLLSFVLALVATAAAVRRLAPRPPLLPFAAIALAGAQPFYTFASSGLETMPAAALIAAAMWASAASAPRRGVWLSSLALTAATMMRPDHALFYGSFGVALVAEDLLHRPDRPLWRRLDLRRYLAYAAPFLLIYVPYFLIRWRVYGDLFPNTYYAKSGHLSHWKQGFVYAAHFVGASGAWAWVPAALFVILGKPHARDETRARIFALLAVPIFARYIMKVGGDFMEYRFFVPLLPIVAVAAEVSLRWRFATARSPGLKGASAAIVALGLAAALLPIRLIQPRTIRWGLSMEPSFYRVKSVSPLVLDTRLFDQGHKLREALTDRGVKAPLAASAIGIVGYYSHLPIIDALGLTNRAIAHKRVPARGRPGHEKLASTEELIEQGAILDSAHKWDIAFQEATQARIGAVQLHFIRLDPAWEQVIAALPGSRMPRPERDVEQIASSASRERILAATRFYGGFLEGHPLRAQVLARLAARLSAVADFEDDALPPEATRTGDGLRVARGARPAGASGLGWLSSLPDKGSGVGRIEIPLGPLAADELRFALGGAPSDRSGVRLLVNGAVVRSASPPPGDGLTPFSWSIADLRGHAGVLVIEDADPAPGAGIHVDAVHVAPVEGDIRQRLAAFDPEKDRALGDLLREAEMLLPPGDPDREKIEAYIGTRWTLDELPAGSTITGQAFGPGPVTGALPDQLGVLGFEGRKLLNSFHGRDAATGRIELPEIELPESPIAVLVGGGNECRKLYVGLEVEGKITSKVCGKSDEILRPALLKVGEHAGKRGRVVIVDDSDGGWGHILVDDIIVPSTHPPE